MVSQLYEACKCDSTVVGHISHGSRIGISVIFGELGARLSPCINIYDEIHRTTLCLFATGLLRKDAFGQAIGLSL